MAAILAGMYSGEITFLIFVSIIPFSSAVSAVMAGVLAIISGAIALESSGHFGVQMRRISEVAAAVRRLSRRRRYLWFASGACLLLVVLLVAEGPVTRIFRGPHVVLPDKNFELLAISPDGRTLYADSSRSHGSDMLVPVDLTSCKAGRPIAIDGVPQGLVITPDGRVLYAILYSGLITLVDLVAGRSMKAIQVKGAQSMAVSPDGRTLYVDTTAESLVAIDIATGNHRAPIQLPHVANPFAVGAWPVIAVTPDGRRLYVDSGDDTVVPVDLTSGKPGAPIHVAGDAPLTLAMASDGSTLYVAVNGDYDSGKGLTCLVEVNTATNASSKPTILGPGPIGLSVAPDGRTLYILSDNQTITPVNTAHGQQGAAIRTAGLFSNASPSDLALTPDGGTLYVAEGAVTAIRLTKLSEGEPFPLRDLTETGQSALGGARPSSSACRGPFPFRPFRGFRE